MGAGVADGAAVIHNGSWSLLLAAAVFSYCAWVIRDGRDEVEAEGLSDVREVLAVACPRCDAEVGEACGKRHRGGTGTMHAARIVEWRRTASVREEIARRERTLARLEGGVI